jgi:hypothetical protein
MRTGCVVSLVVLLLAAAPSAGWAVCGNGVREGDEQCDGADLGGQTCASVTSGFVQGGTLACTADCKFDTSDCRRAFLQSLTPARGGVQKNRCQLEWTVVGATGKGGTLQCSEGDDTCDQDHQFNNVCTMTVQLCLNVPDPKVAGCAFMSAPGKVFRVELLQPSLGSDLGQKVGAGILGAASDLARPAGITAHVSGNSVSYSPPVTDFECGKGTISIALRGTEGHARAGKVHVRIRSSDNSGKIKATGVLTLVCNP